MSRALPQAKQRPLGAYLTPDPLGCMMTKCAFCNVEAELIPHVTRHRRGDTISVEGKTYRCTSGCIDPFDEYSEAFLFVDKALMRENHKLAQAVWLETYGVPMPPSERKQTIGPTGQDSSMTNTIQLVELDGSLHTSYSSRDGLTSRGGKPIPWTEAKRVGDYKAPRKSWRASQGTAAALLAANQAVVAAGWPGLRVTEAIRDHEVVERERNKYDFWIASGKPDPKSSTYNAKNMRHVYIKRPNETNHQWGGAVDFDVFAWAQDGAAKGLTGNQSLSALWELLAPHGFTPILVEPFLNQSEAWHFDHYGSLSIVRGLFTEHRNDGAAYADRAGLTAMTGCILAGTYVGERKLEKLVQARLLIAGHWVGLPDGDLGKKTRAGLAAAGLPSTGALPGLGELLGQMDAAGVGMAEVADA